MIFMKLALVLATNLHPVICEVEAESSVSLETCTTGSSLVGSESANCTIPDEEEEEQLITEAGYTPPLNRSFPAPRSTDGLGSDLGEPQKLDATYSNEIATLVEKAREYMERTVMVEEKYEDVRSICVNKHESCAFWSVLGECENNPAYMLINCGPVCFSCEMMSVETRCPLDPEAKDAWGPGDLNDMFERITTDAELKKYNPIVLSKPPEGPWMIQMENFLSDEEADRLIELGGLQGYERSADVGKKNPDGTFGKNVNSGRTSTNAWCIDSCEKDPIAQIVVQRIENVTGIPETNSENLQLLRYEEDQFYNTHNDYIPYQIDRQCGVRILTFYMYLNDVEEGGGTNFPNLDMTVTPKRGRVVMWPSVFDDDPNKQDSRTNHQAMKVIRGVKYGANAWIHQRDYKNPNKNGCN